MKKKGLYIIAGLAAVLVVLQILVLVGNSNANISNKNIKVVTAPDQKEAMENEQFTIPEFEMPKIKGKNVALNCRAKDNGYNDVYPAANAVDGRTDTVSYWEGSPDEEESLLTLNLKKSYKIHTFVVALNPDPLWGKRTQTFSISVSSDGKNYTEVKKSADYDFNPVSGNLVVIDDFDAVKAQYVQISITDNTGAKAGQVAEFQAWAN